MMASLTAGRVNTMTVPTVSPPQRLAGEAVFRTSVTVAFCVFLLIKLAAPELLDSGLSVASQLLLLVALLLAAAATGWSARAGRSAEGRDAAGSHPPDRGAVG
jgi:hypothetical protein